MNITTRLKYAFTRKAAWIFVPLFLIGSFVPPVRSASATSTSFPDAGFEDGTFTGWEKGSQSGALGSTITGNGTGVTIFTGSRTFTHSQHGAMGSPTKQDGSANPYYAPAVSAGSWTFGPNNAAKAVALQPIGQITFSDAMTALGLSGSPQTAIQAQLTADRNASGFGSPTPTNAAWITREVQLTAGTTYTMSWNYLGTDYVPYNDGSVTGLVPVTVTGTPVIRVNNYVQSYALLGFTNPGTGDYSTNSYGATGWQTSTYKVDITGTYKLGFAVFNLGDTSLSPVLMIDSEAGSTERCVSGTCTTFGGVASNSETAPTVPPTTTTTVAQTTTTSSTTTTSTTTTTIPAATSLEVTSLLDDGSSGTLRWAITQANATAGGIYDAIDITTEGTITLTSDLPAITAGVTITGTGMATTIIDGNNLWRAIYNNGSRTIVIEDITFKQGKNVSWDGGLIYNASGTMTFNRIKISNHSSWAFYQGGGGVTTFNNSQFTNNGYAITSDHGNTPDTLSLTDTDYSNRIYVNGSTFTSNTYGIRTERFVKINNSQFTGNTQVGAYLGGLNRQQVLNSTFTSNGVGVYFSSWIPTSWAVGAGNQTVSGNTFNGNTTAIQFANNWDNGSSVYNGVSANSFSTASGNTFGSTAQNTNNFSGSGYVESNNTITAAYLNPVTNLTAVANADGSVDLDWDASAASNCVIYGYSVSFYDLTVIGGATSGGWGVWTNQGTNYSLSTGMFSGSNPVTTGYGPVRFGIKAMTGGCAGVGTGSCTYGPEVTVDATVLDPTTTSSTTTTTTSTTVVPIVVTPPDGTTVPLPQYPEPETESTTVQLPVETGTETELPTETIPEYSEPIGIDPTETETVVVIIPPDDYTVTDIEDNEPITTVILDNILENTFTTDIEADEVGAVLDTLLGAELTNAQFDNVLEAVFTEDVSADVFTEALTTMLDADITSAQLTAVLDSAFSEDTSAENMVSALESIFDGPLSSGDLDTVMAAVFDEDISAADTMTVLEDLLETNLSMSQTEAIFDSVFDSDLSDAETIDLIVDVLADELTSELLDTVLGSVFDEEVSNEVLIETFTAVLGNELDAESVGVIVDVLESDTITSEQVGQVVTLVIEQEGGIDPGQSAALSASPKVLESITPDQATEVFAALDVANVSPEQEAQLAEALTNAPDDIKDALEQEVDIYGEGFDDYVAVGSQVDVGSRRTLIAATTAVAGVVGAAATGGASGGSTGGSGGSSGGGSGGSGSTNTEGRSRREEEGQEAAGEIAGPEEDENGKFTRNSIFKYEEGTMERKFNLWGFIKKFAKETAGLSFTLAGSVVVFITLSGDTRKIAMIATGVALAVHYTHQMLQNDED